MMARLPVIAARWALAVWCLSTGASSARAEPDLELFTREGCPRCVDAKRFLEGLLREDPRLVLVIRPVDRDEAALARFRQVSEAAGIAVPGLPTLVVRGDVLVGFDGAETTGARIREALASGRGGLAVAGASGASDAGVSRGDAMCGLEAVCEGGAPANGPPGGVRHGGSSVDTTFGRVSVEELGLPVFTLVLGLIDGFNPCAMWVLLFLLSMLVNLKDRRRMAIIAATFVAASGVVYFAFMAAWLNVFLLIGLSRGVQIGLGVLGLLVAAINIKDFFAFKVGVSLTISDSAKPGLYARTRKILREQRLMASLAGVVVLAVAVNLVELLCTAGLPAVYTAVLAEQGIEAFDRYAYLALYNVAYMADDALMVTIAIVTMDKTRLTERGGRWLKLVSGLVMLLLGLALVFFPEALF